MVGRPCKGRDCSTRCPGPPWAGGGDSCCLQCSCGGLLESGKGPAWFLFQGLFSHGISCQVLGPFPLLARELPTGTKNTKRWGWGGERGVCVGNEISQRPVSDLVFFSKHEKQIFCATLVINKILTSTLCAQLFLGSDKAWFNLFNETFYHELSVSCEIK